MPTPRPIVSRARALRTTATEPERILWRHLARLRPRFTRQRPPGPYILDFACRSAMLAIELDGRSHDATAAHDAHRATYLQSQGWRILRFPNAAIRENPTDVATAIARAVEELTGHPVTYAERRQRTPKP